ncbi:MAG: arylsulfatase [Rhodothermales bacterium]
MAAARPNILWYCTDQQRYDTIAALGNPVIRTPAVDALVDEGVAFTQAYCQSPICTPSRASFMTGRYPASHHVNRNGNPHFPLEESLVTTLLAEGGYDCGLIGKQHLSRSNILEKRIPNDGYRVFHWSHHPYPDWEEGHAYDDWLRAQGHDPKALYDVIASPGPGVPAELHQTKWASDVAIDFISESREGPWMLNMNVFDPHPPFDPPAEYLDRYNPAEMPPPLFKPSDIPRQKQMSPIDQQMKEAIDPRTPRVEAEADADGDARFRAPKDFDAGLIKACYYAMIELIDDQFARVVDALKASGQYDNTLIIFTSDHGEMLGDHGVAYKGCRFFEGLIHVPMVISWPAGMQSQPPSAALVELVDLAPTLLDAAELPIPENIQGKSLLPILRGESTSVKSHVLCEYNDALAGVGMDDHSHGIMVYDGRYKICVYQGHHHLGEIYDLHEDPGEFNNLWNKPQHSALKGELLGRALDVYMSTSDAGMQRTGRY